MDMRALLTVSIVAIASSALADTQSSIKRAFGNTIVSTYPDGRKSEIWLAADGTYTGLGRKKTDPSSGRWTIKGEKICFKQTKPKTVPISVCIKVPDSGLEKGFHNKAVTGEMTTVTLKKGHIKP